MKKLIFYYPQHFNRSKDGTNPFFDPLLETCRRRNIPYRLYEEPGGAGKPHNGKAKSAKWFLRAVLVIRKLAKLTIRNKNFYEREKVVGRIVDSLTLGRFRADVYITISGSMFWLFAAINPKAQVYDLQHGILFKHHKTFFDEKTLKLRPQYYNPCLNILFWGEGFRELFIKDEEKMMEGKAHIIGYPLDYESKQTPIVRTEMKNLLFSLQFTDDFEVPVLNALKEDLKRIAEETRDLGVTVWLKHHPRYGNCIDISDVIDQYPHLRLTQEPLSVLAGEMDLHLTYFSTTAFEYAQYGVPTYFIPQRIINNLDNVFYSEFGYTLYENMSLRDVIERLRDRQNIHGDSLLVQEWYKQYFSPYDENAFLQLI